MQERLLSQVRACVREEVQNALREHQVTAARSQAATPLPDPQHTQATIMAMLRQGQVNQAFQQVTCSFCLPLTYHHLVLYMQVCDVCMVNICAYLYRVIVGIWACVASCL